MVISIDMTLAVEVAVAVVMAGEVAVAVAVEVARAHRRSEHASKAAPEKSRDSRDGEVGEAMAVSRIGVQCRTH